MPVYEADLHDVCHASRLKFYKHVKEAANNKTFRTFPT